MTDRMDINRLLMEMRSLRAQSQAFQGPQTISQGMAGRDVAGGPQAINNGPKFADLMSQAVNKVNSVQQHSSSLQSAYLRGDAGVDITDVMIASQKSSVAFDAVVQVRNKVVEAYKDVMNMPI